MRTPTFWNKRNFIARCLLPIGVVYSAATSLRLKLKKSRKAKIPVICVGNLTAGGTGKTPVSISVAQLLKSIGYNPCFVSRGYGGKLSGITVNPQIHSAKEVGDEPLLLARTAPVFINPDRYQAAQEAAKSDADIIVMDDGFQNPSLAKDVSLLVFDGGFGIGNAYPLPAGPLRENFTKGLKRASAAVIIGEDKFGLESMLGNIPVFKGKIVSELPKLNSDKVIAFAGIGRPQKFYDSLKQYDIKIIDTIDFPDHHFYTISELRNMVEQAESSGAELITTAKDYVKIPHDLQSRFKVLEIKIEWQDSNKLKDFLQNHL